MDETSRNLQELLGLVGIIAVGGGSLKLFLKWLPTFLERFEKYDPDRPEGFVESRVITARGETVRAEFRSKKFGGKTLLILDRGNGADIPPKYFHARYLTPWTQGGWNCRHVGPPIEVGEYQDLPPERRGFVFLE